MRGQDKPDIDEFASLITETDMTEQQAHVFLLVLNRLTITHRLNTVQREERKQQSLTSAKETGKPAVDVLRGMFGASGHG